MSLDCLVEASAASSGAAGAVCSEPDGTASPTRVRSRQIRPARFEVETTVQRTVIRRGGKASGVVDTGYQKIHHGTADSEVPPPPPRAPPVSQRTQGDLGCGGGPPGELELYRDPEPTSLRDQPPDQPPTGAAAVVGHRSELQSERSTNQDEEGVGEGAAEGVAKTDLGPFRREVDDASYGHPGGRPAAAIVGRRLGGGSHPAS